MKYIYFPINCLMEITVTTYISCSVPMYKAGIDRSLICITIIFCMCTHAITLWHQSKLINNVAVRNRLPYIIQFRGFVDTKFIFIEG